MEQSIG